MSGANGEVTIDLDRVFLDACNDAVKASTWMPAEYTANDWQADVLDLLRNGPGTFTPQPSKGVDASLLREAFICGYKHGACHYIGGNSTEELHQAAMWAVDHQDPDTGIFVAPPAASVDDEVREWVRANLPESYANKPLIEILRLLNAAGVEAEQDLIDSAGGAKENDNGA